MAEDITSNPNELGDEQADGTQESQNSEQPTDQGSESFTDVDLDSIDEDNITLDELKEMRSNMNADYTRKTQGLSQLQADADLWRQIEGSPALAGVMSEAIYNVNHNLPVDGSRQEQQEGDLIPDPSSIDPNDDPAGFFGAIVNQVVAPLFKQQQLEMSELKQQMGNVDGYVRTNQSQLEFDNLANDYPGLKVVGLAAIKRVQAQNPGVGMKQALGIMALDQPDLLNKTNSRPIRRRLAPRTERSDSTKSGDNSSGVPPEVKGRVQDLQNRAKQLEKDGNFNLRSAIRSATAKLAGRGE